MEDNNNREIDFTIKDHVLIGFFLDLNGQPEDAILDDGIIDWVAITSRCQTHPQETMVDIFPGTPAARPGEEMTCLHAVLWFDVPVETVDAILRANPSAIHNETSQGTALDIACTIGSCSPQVVINLARAEKTTPRTKNEDSGLEENDFANYYRSHIWFAHSINRVEIVQALLSEYAHLVPKHSRPLDEIIENYPTNSDENKDLILFYWLLAYDQSEVFLHPETPERLSSFHPINALLRFLGEEKNTSPCHEGVMEILKSMNVKCPQFFRSVDRFGLLPLHVLLEKNGWVNKALSTFLDATKVEHREKHLGDIIRFLVMQHKESARNCIHGKTPLHLAIANGWPIDAILEAAPNAVNIKDPKTGLYPFQLAAIVGTEKEELLKNTKEYILKSHPDYFEKHPLQRLFTDSIEVEQTVAINLSKKLLLENPSLLDM